MHKPVFHYFRLPILAFVLAVIAAFIIAGPAMAITVAVLAILEVSLSFDNAVVNAHVLENWDEKWRKIFLTWGILIAVFGMRLLFPIAIVSVAAHMSPVDATVMALTDPAKYAATLTGVHYMVAAFGGVFLLKVGLTHFLDKEKDHHWLGPIERFLSKIGMLDSAEIMIVLIAVLALAGILPAEERYGYIFAGALGLVTYLATKAVGTLATGGGDVADKVIKAGIGGFIYLEVLDASFSFDGVIGAFALTNNIVWITVGLFVGAFAVRELTLLAVDRGTLQAYPHLEHGAFWAIIALGGLMLISPVFEVPEWITGLLGAIIIGAAFITSLIENKKQADGLLASA
ncbi:membrane protein [Caulobacter phage CcrSC]|uniref:Integral membrane protein n=1 Tax=Caulobacter phage CcrSC TaxID=2283272 RepID=A0A385ED98_9CAUD|nr:membrane protein [Caulobacter phage CcrSC]AXQ69831.1 integral membrane protein [Caulobacter phage CcrSC]